jgi:hypothetical protein
MFATKQKVNFAYMYVFLNKNSPQDVTINLCMGGRLPRTAVSFCGTCG